jgi:hypothetical protein
LVVLVITGGAKENGASLKVVVVVEVVDVRFLLPFGLPRGLDVIMKGEAKGGGEGSMAVRLQPHCPSPFVYFFV